MRQTGPARPDFYRQLLFITLPIMIQNGITNLVSMLDNIMVGQIGTAQMSGVSIVNQLVFVFNLAVFGAVSGAGIYTAQFHGKGDRDGIRYTFRFKLIISLLLALLGMGLFVSGGSLLAGFYIHETGPAADRTLFFALRYMRIILTGFIPFALMQAFAGTLRECGDTFLPMAAGIGAVLVNLFLNYVLIFGRLGAPALGVEGAALATVLSRFFELLVVVFFARRKKERHPWLEGALASLKIPGDLAGRIALRGLPLLANEFLWASSQAVLVSSYAYRGLSVVAAMNISQTITNVFNVVFISMGSAAGIIIGQELGAGTKTVREDARRLILVSSAVCLFIGAGLFSLAPFFPGLYNTEEEVRLTAAALIRCAALFMPLNSYNNACYFILRSGGKTLITFLFDSCFCWAVMVPLSFLLTRYTALSIVPVYLLCCGSESIKSVLGTIMIRKGIWIQDLTRKTGG